MKNFFNYPFGGNTTKDFQPGQLQGTENPNSPRPTISSIGLAAANASGGQGGQAMAPTTMDPSLQYHSQGAMGGMGGMPGGGMGINNPHPQANAQHLPLDMGKPGQGTDWGKVGQGLADNLKSGMKNYESMKNGINPFTGGVYDGSSNPFHRNPEPPVDPNLVNPAAAAAANNAAMGVDPAGPSQGLLGDAAGAGAAAQGQTPPSPGTPPGMPPLPGMGMEDPLKKLTGLLGGF